MGFGLARRVAVRFGVGIGVRVAVRVAVGRGVGVRVGVSVGTGVGVGVDVGVSVGGAATENIVSPQSYGVARRYRPADNSGNCTELVVAPRASVGPQRNSPIGWPVSVAYTAQI